MKRELSCDALLDNPLLATPPEPAPPPPPRKPVYKKKLIFPPRFPLIDVDTWNSWVNHRKGVWRMRPKVDDSPPPLYPELYLKPRKLDFFARQLERNMNVNKELLKKINIIQRTGGWVDSWLKCSPHLANKTRLLVQQRQRDMDIIHRHNVSLYRRLIVARSDMLLTKELDEEWKETKKKLILGASLPFILFKTETLDHGMKDPDFEKPPGVHRDRAAMQVTVIDGSKVGKLFVELFTEVAPKTCALFLSLIKGDGNGCGYKGTSIFRIVPRLYCRVGDVVKNNGFGLYIPPGEVEASTPENFILKHSVPGTLSMVVNNDYEVTAQFNIIFKPLHQFDGRHVVFGRIVSGPADALEQISVNGLPLGIPTKNVVIQSCGALSRRGNYVEGAPNTTRFPPSRFTK